MNCDFHKFYVHFGLVKCPDHLYAVLISIFLVCQKISLTTSLTYMVSCRYLMRPCVVDIPQKYIIRYLTRTLTICSEILGYTTDKEFGWYEVKRRFVVDMLCQSLTADLYLLWFNVCKSTQGWFHSLNRRIVSNSKISSWQKYVQLLAKSWSELLRLLECFCQSLLASGL